MGRTKSNNKRRRTNRRRKTGARARVGQSNPRTRISPAGLKKLSVMRNFSLYPRQWTQTGGRSWLDKLSSLGSIAMRIFTMLLSTDQGVSTTWQIVGSVQVILIGPEDLAWSSPIKENGLLTVTHQEGLGVSAVLAPTIDYQQGKITRFTVKLTAGSEASRRAGRVSMALSSLTRGLASRYREDATRIKVPTFDQLVLMPGAITAPFGPTLTQSWVPSVSDVGGTFTAIGQDWKPQPTDPSAEYGGEPVVALYVGYQDFACSTADPSALYAPEEALFNVDISGYLHLKQWGSSWIRARPHVSDASVIDATIGNMRTLIPGSNFTFKDGVLTLPWEKMTPRLQKYATLQASLSHPLSLLTQEDDAGDEEFEFVALNNLKIQSPPAQAGVLTFAL